MKNIFFTIVFAFAFINIYSQIDISDARAMNLDEEVVIEGVATNGSELGIIRYLQDASGAIAVYPGSGSNGDFPGDVKRGDLVRVTGRLKEFNGLLEVDPVLSYEVLSSDNDLPDPLTITPADLTEQNEAVLSFIEGVKFENGGAVFGVGNYSFTANGEDGEIYVRSNHPLIGSEVPLANVNLTGIVSQFNSIYQLLLRDSKDIEVTDNFFLTSSPSQSDISKSGFKVSWTTNVASDATVRYGTTMALGEEVTINTNGTSHEVILDDLEAGEFYYVQAISNNGQSEVLAPMRYFATGSNSSGEVQVYFNHDVNGTISNGSFPNGTTPSALESAILSRINAAQTSIDVAAYNVNRRQIIDALTEAYERGVVVRYIADDDTANLALSDPRPPFPIVRGNSDGLMHNKFLAIDVESVDNSWVISGSTNFTEQNIATDYNNLILIQDQALAKAYTIEFEEMWGSDGPDPGIFSVTFGPNKVDNTPHTFLINGIIVESYFSPSDNTTLAISRSIASSDTDVLFALLTFTNNELGSAVLNAYRDNVEVRGIIDNVNDQGSEFAFLEGQGVNVTQDNNNKQTHHKYCLVDASNEFSDPLLITGSHNWSGGAETRNDENTLIFHDAILVNLFLQEFEARWCEVQNGANCTTSNENVEKIDGIELNTYPNPTSDLLNLSFDSEEGQDIVVQILDVQGRSHQSTVYRNLQGKVVKTFDVSAYPSGVYYLNIATKDQSTTRVFEVVR